MVDACCTAGIKAFYGPFGDIADLEYVDDTVGWILVGTAGVVAPPVITV